MFLACPACVRTCNPHFCVSLVLQTVACCSCSCTSYSSDQPCNSHMLHAVQAPILCEMAAFVASCCTEGEEVSKAYCSLAEQWATELENELTVSQQAASTLIQDGSAQQIQLEQSELKAKITICHYLVVIACGCSAAPATMSLRNLEPYAGQLCKHMLLVCSNLPFTRFIPPAVLFPASSSFLSLFMQARCQ